MADRPNTFSLEEDVEVFKTDYQLKLLLKEYKRLESHLYYIEHKYNQTLKTDKDSNKNFVSRLLNIVADLFDKLQYSDIRVLLKGGNHLNCHKFVLLARSNDWGVSDFQQAEELDFTDINYQTAYTLMKWVYTDHLETGSDVDVLVDLLLLSSRYKLWSLISRCENGILPLITVDNCKKIDESTRGLDIPNLHNYCSSYIHYINQKTEKVINVTNATTGNLLKIFQHNELIQKDSTTNIPLSSSGVKILSTRNDTRLSRHKTITSEYLKLHGKVLNVELHDETAIMEIDPDSINHVSSVAVEIDSIVESPVPSESRNDHVEMVDVSDKSTFVIKVKKEDVLNLENVDIIEVKNIVHENGYTKADSTSACIADDIASHTGRVATAANIQNKQLMKSVKESPQFTTAVHKLSKKRRRNKQNYECKVCHKFFLNNHKLMVHTRTHSGIKPYPCTECEKTFACNGTLQAHIRIHTGIRPYICDICSKGFVTNSALRKHRLIHTGEKPYKCSICSKTFRLSQGLKIHVKRHLGDKKFQCEICDKTFVTQGAVSTHKKYTHEKLRQHSCDVCGKTFQSKSSVNVHQIVHTNIKEFKCDECGRHLGSLGGLVKHKRLHAGILPFKCEICEHAFNTKYDLKIHIRRHTKERPYQCDLCGESFATKPQLEPHMRKHRKERPFQCTKCNKAFYSKAALQNHEKIHSGVKPLQCHECGKGFIRPNKLRAHIASIHSKSLTPSNNDNKKKDNVSTLEVFRCQYCDKNFYKESMLKAHMKLHVDLDVSEDQINNIIYQCSVCEKTFNQLNILEIHMKIHEHDMA